MGPWRRPVQPGTCRWLRGVAAKGRLGGGGGGICMGYDPVPKLATAYRGGDGDVGQAATRGLLRPHYFTPRSIGLGRRASLSTCMM
jgi:hypothetical protein